MQALTRQLTTAQSAAAGAASAKQRLEAAQEALQDDVRHWQGRAASLAAQLRQRPSKDVETACAELPDLQQRLARAERECGRLQEDREQLSHQLQVQLGTTAELRAELAVCKAELTQQV